MHTNLFVRFNEFCVDILRMEARAHGSLEGTRGKALDIYRSALTLDAYSTTGYAYYLNLMRAANDPKIAEKLSEYVALCVCVCVCLFFPCRYPR